MNEDYQIIQSLIETILEKMGINGRIEIMEDADWPMFTVMTDEAGILIGENGQNLLSFSHILKKIAAKEFQEKNKEIPRFSFDVNGYYAKKIDDLKENSKMNAQRAR